MSDYKKYTCPACHGKGCQLCQGKGIVMATQEQINRARSMLQKAKLKQKQQTQQPQPKISQKNHSENKIKNKKNWVNLITLIILLILAGGATTSYIYFKSLRPFLAGLVTLAIIITTAFLWNSALIKPNNVKDFLSQVNYHG